MFGSNREDKNERKAQELLSKYGLENLSDPKDLESVRKIALDLAGNGLMSLGISLTGKAEDIAMISCLRALIEQNWIIIRQLDRIAKKEP